MKPSVNQSEKMPIQSKDLARISQLKRKIKHRRQKGLAFDQLEEKLASQIEKSQAVSLEIANKIPSVSLKDDLPITQKQQEIVDLIKSNQQIVLAGETGCGKTTQLPKLCLLAGLGIAGKIAHTQPRRVAATSVANRIAEEIGEAIGQTVGYSVRFQEKKSQQTRIQLMTDGILLAELQRDPLLKNYEVVIIDEAHERSLNIDFLLGFLKQICQKRPDFKVIVTSATIDPQGFSKYFNNAPVVLVEGRTYPVEVRYLVTEDETPEESSENVTSNYRDSDPILNKIEQAIEEAVAISTGDILIFSNGEAEIKTIAKHLEKQYKKQYCILPLYARLGIGEQQRIFKASSQRKIIIATNVAETSLTIPNILFVIDLGTARISRYSHKNKIQQLPIEKISKASAEQRKGRCGRVAPGICFRLYSEQDYEQREDYTPAEIKRVNLSSVVLRLKSLSVEQVETFPFIEAPSDKQWKAAFNQLFELGAMDSNNRITPLAKQMAKLPLDPQLARILVNDGKSLLDEALIICSFLSVRDIRLRPQDKQQKSDQCLQQFIDKASDVMTIVKMWRELNKKRASGSSSAFRKWCQNNFINFIGWLEWRNIYFQTKETLESIGIRVSTSVATAEDCHFSLIPGFISHLLNKTNEPHYQGARGIKVWIHPSSQFFKQSSRWLVSTEMLETQKIYARGNFPIQSEWLVKIAPHLIKSRYYEPHWRKRNGFVAAFLDQTLLGLPIINKKIIDYSKIEAEKAREIFLLEALAKDQLNVDFPFVLHNRKLLTDLHLEEQKQRSKSIRISDSALAELYATQLPEKINSQKNLKLWLKKNWQQRNRQLSFSREKLVQNESQGVEEYPGQIVIHGVSLNLRYQFAPGEKYDGVTVVIPSAMVNQFNQSDFEWLVPGYLNQKIQAVLKNLPKPIRKQLIPISESADLVTESLLKLDYQRLDFKQTLCDLILKKKAVKISVSDIDLDNIDNHLKMKFTSDISGKNSSHVKLSLSELKSTKNIRQSKSNDTTHSHEQKKYYSWPDSFQAIEFITKQKTIDVRVFQGIEDQEFHVCVNSFPSLRLAKKAHQQGVARLLLIDQLQKIKSIKNTWPDRQQIELLNLHDGGFDRLFDWLALSVAYEMVEKSGLIESKQAFNQLCQSSSQLSELLAQRLTDILKLLRVKAKIYGKLDDIEADYCRESIKDIRDQLKQLWQLDYFLLLGRQLDTRYMGYFEAIEERMTRIQEKYPKEQAALSVWNDWQEWWQELQNLSLIEPGPELLLEAFWHLEEYRLSLFAPNQKRRFTVSAKKLQKLFERIESLERH